MVRYETLILASPDITSQEVEQLQKSYSDAIKEFGGQLVSFERWGKFRLAYPVKRNDYGVYFLTRFEVESNVDENALNKALRTMFDVRFTNNVLRNLTSVLDVKKGLSYTRPESLEEQPSEHSYRESAKEAAEPRAEKPAREVASA